MNDLVSNIVLRAREIDLQTMCCKPSLMQAASAKLQGLLQKQFAKLAQTEQELYKAKQTINERKVIDRAKGALMSRMGMTEEAAYRALQKAAMDHNKRMLDVAEATLAFSDIAPVTTPSSDAS